MLIYIITLVCLILFSLMYLKSRTSLINGFLFVGVMGFLLFSLMIFSMENNIGLLTALLMIIFGIASIFILTSVFWVIIFSFYSAYMLFKKESRSLANFLSLFLGLFLIFWIFVPNLINNTIINFILSIIGIIFSYGILMFMAFFTTSCIYPSYFIFEKVDYIIILGAGLINGNKVSKLLASRIDKGINLFNSQIKKGFSPKIIMSGGQGNDETLPESIAMKKYAMEQGINEDDIIVEDKSKNTYENMLFSKTIINDENAKVVFSTNNFHVYRAGIYAKKAKLNAKGIGSKTKFYYWYNAIIREYIAVMVIYKKFNVICLSLLLFAFGILYFFTSDIILEIIRRFNG
ncbi:MAG: YdcF family protein [Erysipelotrichaceae bacterium]|nr:YdcF family protein [Erysipelotrichaceae bacterium]